MKKLSTALTAGLIAFLAVGCNNTDTTVETPPAPETAPAAQDTVLAGSEGAGDYNDTPDSLTPINELDDIEGLETTVDESTPIETSEQAVTEVDDIVAELDAIDSELAALDDLLNDL